MYSLSADLGAWPQSTSRRVAHLVSPKPHRPSSHSYQINGRRSWDAGAALRPPYGRRASLGAEVLRRLGSCLEATLGSKRPCWEEDGAALCHAWRSAISRPCENTPPRKGKDPSTGHLLHSTPWRPERLAGIKLSPSTAPATASP